MVENVNERKIFSLADVSLSIQRTLSERYKSVFWVKAEMNKLNYYPHSGHCYPDLVEKKDGKIVAQLRSTLWRDDYNRINRDFLRIVKAPLKDGIQMLFCARILFDPVHGLSLRIIDIDPSFSLGELEREKLETIERLKKEGIFDRNKNLTLPQIPQRIAIISVQTSKGYADFLNVIEGNPWGYKFVHILFPSLLQGDRAVESILHQLKRIRQMSHHFDAVAIIRGGGGEVGLSCFNNFQLAREIAIFPIPVLSGIGHATNETVVEMVAHRNSITPTDLANQLLEKFRLFDSHVQEFESAIIQLAETIIEREAQNFTSLTKLFKSVSKSMLLRKQHEAQKLSQSVIHGSLVSLRNKKDEHRETLFQFRKLASSFHEREKQKVANISFALTKDIRMCFVQQSNELKTVERSIQQMHPQNVLNRGYSITTLNGKVVTKIDDVKPGDTIITTVADGAVESEVKSKTQELL